MSNLSEVSKLVLTAAISSVVSIGLYKTYENKTQKNIQNESTSSSYSSGSANKELNQEEEVLIKEQLSRGIIFFGEDKVEKIRKSFVIVVGLGGVGSHAATMLVRNGVERIRLIDFDQVTLSSLNRHANATRLDVGKSKASVLKDHLLKICPHVEIETREAIFSESNAEELLAGNPDYVLDCIDNITTKAFLLKYCKEKEMKVICSMGAGAKCDPSRLLIADISHTSADPLSRAIRKMLKKFGIDKGIPTVFSCEIPTIGLVPLPEEQAREAEAYQVIPEFRIRILPVLGPLPATFGNAMAAYVLQHLAGAELKQLPIKGRSEFNKKAFHQYQMRERDIRKIAPETIPFTPEDVDYVIEEIWRNKSGISGAIEHLVLTIWDRSRPAGTDNCILMTMKELAKHDKLTSLAEGYPPEVINRIEAVFEEERQLNKVRTLYKFT